MNGGSRSCRLRSEQDASLWLRWAESRWVARFGSLRVAVKARRGFAGCEVDVVRWKAGCLPAGYATSL
jgi:hypothetical protein